ncbi:MAG: penicillin-binding protein 2 [Anaerolineae bacterium]|nr:MAG: penicillin-binding protein 2 [Anaerolineae bacterium]
MKLIGVPFMAFVLAACGTATTSPPSPPGELPDPLVLTESAPDPEAAAREFLEAWKVRDYATMYDMLSPLTQDSITPEAFAERYDDIWRSAALTGLDYEIVSSFILNPRQSQVRLQTALHSLAAGDINRDLQMDLTLVDDAWTVAWSDGLILPELENGRNLFLDVVTPTRANIYDRSGLALAAESEAVALWIVPNQIGDEDAELDMLSTIRRLMDYPSNDSIQVLYDQIRDTNFRVNLGEVPLEAFQQVQGILSEVGGVQWGTYDTRLYFDGGLAPHAMGYISWIQEEDLQDYLLSGYQGDEFVGQIGLEYWYEEALRGRPGGTLYTTDAAGRPDTVIASQESEPPYAVYATLDRELQRHAQQALEDSDLTGAVIVLERDTGAVLAMASTPDFDPNLFDTNNPNSASGLSELFQIPKDPLLNRATVGAYPLGSVFKTVTMAAALESGFYDADTIYNCGLEFRELPGITLYDWRYEKGLPASGEITLQQALVRSCNPYFFRIGLDLYNRGLETAISDMAKGFGLGEPTGIEIGEQAGLVPDPETKLALFGDEWAPSDSVQLAIGQSFLQATPIQVARMIAAIGNGGTLYQPQIVDRVQSAEGEILSQFEPIVQGTLPVSSENLEVIQEAMVGVIRDPRGTARKVFLGLDLDIAGKTGTAQTGDFTPPHAWFVAYTFEEREDIPDIVVVVVLEFQGEGSEWAAPVARRVIESYFLGRPTKLYPWEARIRIPATPEPESEEDADGQGG